jgi:hypothetical protein
MIVWGGKWERSVYPEYPSVHLDDGAAYDPASRKWHPIPSAPLAGRERHVAVWTGSEMIVWGGENSTGVLRDGAALSPSTDKWRVIADAPFTLREPLAVWTGVEVLVVGTEFTPNATPRQRERAAAYDPATDRWRVLPDVPIENDPEPNPVDPGYTNRLAWVDGFAVLDVQYVRSRTPVSPSIAARIVVWDVKRERWLSPAAFRFSKRDDVGIVAIDDEVVVSVSSDTYGEPEPEQLAYRYRPSTGDVVPLQTLGSREADGDPVWTGQPVIFLGQIYDPRPVAFDPKTGSWKRVDVSGAGVEGASIIWTGKQIIIWGGYRPAPDIGRATTNRGVAFAPFT